jgi:S-(hydroxymethyl)glutathione dehydrogenase/alcohol dehydrogenase
MGVGGVGSFSVQGALHSGATNVIAVDPEPRRLKSAETVGATHGCSTIEEAHEIACGLTAGQGADATIVTVGTLKPQHVSQALASVRKAGTVVVAGLGPFDEIGVPINMFELILSQKRLQGSMYGGSSPFRDVPRFLDMYVHGQLLLDEVVTRTYTLDEVNLAYAHLEAGDNVRGVITFD